MKDKRQRIAMAWPYAVYTDPTFAATVLQAAAASAHANGTLPDIAAIANAYQYSAAAAAAAAGPSYFHGATGGGDYAAKFQPQHYVGPMSVPGPPPPPHQSLMMKKPPFAVGHHHHLQQHQHHNHQHQHHHHGQFAADAADNKTTTSSSSASSSASSVAAAAVADAVAGTSCKCGIVDCVLTTNGAATSASASVESAAATVGDGARNSSTPPQATPVADRLRAPSSASFFTAADAATTTAVADDQRHQQHHVQSAECSLAVHKHVYHKEYAKNKLFQPYKSDVAAKLNL